MNFPTQYNQKNDFYTCSGTKTIDLLAKKKTGEKIEEYGYEYEYKEEYDKDGHADLVICGRKNVYDYIQSFKQDTDIKKILEKYLGGDLSVIDKNKGFYADISSMPKNFSDFHNKIIEGQRIYDGLPTDFKSEFGNNINAFMNSIYDESFEGKYNDYVNRKSVRSSHISNMDTNVSNGVSNISNEGIVKGDNNNV